MKKFFDIHDRHIRRNAIVAALLACGFALSSCDSAIYEQEGDCDPHYMVRFRYDRNMKYADAFAHEVDGVRLYLADSNGKIVWQGEENGENLKQEGYTMNVDVAPGRYDLLAWCYGGDGSSFSIEHAQSLEDLEAYMVRQHDEDGAAWTDNRLTPLYHGRLASVEFPETEGTHLTTVGLTKDTNYIKVVLQQMAGKPMEPSDFEILITDDNGYIGADNSLKEDETISYRPSWPVTPIYAEITPDDERAEVSGLADASEEYTGVMAEFLVSRLEESHRDDAMLTVRNRNTGKTVLSVKLIDFLLKVRGYYNREMDEQEYLDRQDEYSLVFFLDEGHEWGSTTIYINSWRVVLQGVDFTDK